MKFETKLAFNIFILGLFILLIVFFISYEHNYKANLQMELHHSNSIAIEMSENFEQLLIEKVKINQTLSISPTLKNTLKKSNNSFAFLSDIKRTEIINQQNKKWKATQDENDAFILNITNNSVAQYLKEQQNNLPGEYGEIFVTNKYGVIIAATAKLTTLAHAHKYWWKGAFNKGKGAIFFDDRGYDASVKGYVLGIVIPIKENNEIIGILKVNLNIMGAINKMILNTHNEKYMKFNLVRSGGEIIFDNENPPLSTRISSYLYKKIQTGNKQAFIHENSRANQIIAMSEIDITSNNNKTHIFGGSFESVDHKKGNSGESWYIINYRNQDVALGSIKKIRISILVTGILLTIALAFVAFIISKLSTKPLKQLIEQTEKIAKTDFSTRITITRNDDIGLLGQAFNKMSEELEKTTTSISNLELEIEQRLNAEKALIKSEAKLLESNKTKDKFFSIIAHDLKSPFNSIIGFSSLINKNFDKYNTKKQKEILGIINEGVQNTYKLLENLLTWSQSQRGKIEFKPEKINLYLLSKDAIEFSSQSANSKSIELNCQITKNININADKDMISSIIRNLISNAIKFTPKNGEVTINESLIVDEKNKEFTKIIVTDTGVGIPEETQAKLFQISENISTEGTDSETGTGLGLILCKEFVEKHGGEIWVESEVGKGTLVCFTIPK